jgi:hypothetical protein
MVDCRHHPRKRLLNLDRSSTGNRGCQHEDLVKGSSGASSMCIMSCTSREIALDRLKFPTIGGRKAVARLISSSSAMERSVCKLVLADI